MLGVISEGSAADPWASEVVVEDATRNKSIHFQAQLYRVFSVSKAACETNSSPACWIILQSLPLPLTGFELLLCLVTLSPIVLHTVSLKQNIVQPDMVKNYPTNPTWNDVADDTQKHVGLESKRSNILIL